MRASWRAQMTLAWLAEAAKRFSARRKAEVVEQAGRSQLFFLFLHKKRGGCPPLIMTDLTENP